MVLRGIATTMLTLVLVACSSKPPSSSTDPPSSTATSPAVSSPTSPSPSKTATIPAYLREYGEDERKAYEAALDDFRSFADHQAELYAEGKATPAAKRFYSHTTAAWQTYWAKLSDFQARGIRVVGRGQVIRIRPSGIDLDDTGGGQLDLKVCGTAKGVKVLQHGTPVSQPKPSPTRTWVRMVKVPDEAHWRVLFDRPGDSC